MYARTLARALTIDSTFLFVAVPTHVCGVSPPPPPFSHRLGASVSGLRLYAFKSTHLCKSVAVRKYSLRLRYESRRMDLILVRLLLNADELFIGHGAQHILTTFFCILFQMCGLAAAIASLCSGPTSADTNSKPSPFVVPWNRVFYQKRRPTEWYQTRFVTSNGRKAQLKLEAATTSRTSNGLVRGALYEKAADIRKFI